MEKQHIMISIAGAKKLYYTGKKENLDKAWLWIEVLETKGLLCFYVIKLN